MELVVATRNRDKLREIRQILGSRAALRGLDEFPAAPEVEEDQETLEGNALKKAASVARSTGRAALADDTGLFVDALGGLPGVHTARYASVDGERPTYAQNRQKLLHEMRGVPPERRGAHFACVIAVAWPDGRTRTVRGECHGTITTNEVGEGGFGFDPVFRSTELGVTFSQAPEEEKNRVSHRGRALAALLGLLEGEG